MASAHPSSSSSSSMTAALASGPAQKATTDMNSQETISSIEKTPTDDSDVNSEDQLRGRENDIADAEKYEYGTTKGPDAHDAAIAKEEEAGLAPVAPILPVSGATPTSSPAAAQAPSPSDGKWSNERLQAFLHEEVDIDLASVPLSAFCFMTGYIDAISFTACYIWCAFQTGNTIQLALALARLFSGPQQGPDFRMPDRQALTSLVAFLIGAFLGRVGDRYGAKSRGWITIGTLLQAGLTLASSLCALYSDTTGLSASRGNPSWTDTLGFLALAFASASMGLQALLGTRIAAHFATTVVLTSIWVQFISDPVLFRWRKIYKQRDYKALAILSLFLGGFVGRALTGSIGPSGTLGIGAGLRVLIAISWLLLPKKKST